MLYSYAKLMYNLLSCLCYAFHLSHTSEHSNCPLSCEFHKRRPGHETVKELNIEEKVGLYERQPEHAHKTH